MVVAAKKKTNSPSILSYLLLFFFSLLKLIQCRSTLRCESSIAFKERLSFMFCYRMESENTMARRKKERYAFSVFADNVLLMICGY